MLTFLLYLLLSLFVYFFIGVVIFLVEVTYGEYEVYVCVLWFSPLFFLIRKLRSGL